MRSSHFLAVLIAVVVGAWIVSGYLGYELPFADEPAPAADDSIVIPEPVAAEPAIRLTDVRVASSVSVPHDVILTITGSTRANRSLNIRARTSGTIEEVFVRDGERVTQGMEIARIAMESRTAQLSRAQAMVERYQTEFDASEELVEGGWRAKTSTVAARANYQSALADLAEIKLDIERTRILMPFDGLIEEFHVEVGEFVYSGDASIAQIFDLDPIVVSGAISERKVKELTLGSSAEVRLITGETVSGVLSKISRVADTATRTFEIEIEVANPDYQIPSGITAGIDLLLATVNSHLISPAALSLDSEGLLGVKIVDAENRVKFVPVEIVASDTNGVRVSGLPDEVTLITVGHGFVNIGEIVNPIHEDGIASSESS